LSEDFFNSGFFSSEGSDCSFFSGNDGSEFVGDLSELVLEELLDSLEKLLINLGFRGRGHLNHNLKEGAQTGDLTGLDGGLKDLVGVNGQLKEGVFTLEDFLNEY